jgi:hypothetical protein
MPHYPHRIRLRGPWECEPLPARAGDLVPAGRRVTMPCGWEAAGLAGFTGRARFTRRFGYPGNIDDDERVWLTCEGLQGPADVTLNGSELTRGHNGPFAFDATRLLQERNRLDIVIEGHPNAGGLWGEVALEVRRTAYLEDMRVETKNAGVEVVGRVTGYCDGPLEVYGMADGRHFHYQTIEASPSGTPLGFTMPVEGPAVRRVRVELVNVATIWYAWEADVPPVAV